MAEGVRFELAGQLPQAPPAEVAAALATQAAVARSHGKLDVASDSIGKVLARLTDTFGIRTTGEVDASALNCEVLVLAVKPQQMKDALAPFKGQLRDQLVISIAAGLRLPDLGRPHAVVFDETYYTNSFAQLWEAPGAPRNGAITVHYRMQRAPACAVVRWPRTFHCRRPVM